MSPNCNEIILLRVTQVMPTDFNISKGAPKKRKAVGAILEYPLDHY
jgi:hypothetical protein